MLQLESVSLNSVLPIFLDEQKKGNILICCLKYGYAQGSKGPKIFDRLLNDF